MRASRRRLSPATHLIPYALAFLVSTSACTYPFASAEETSCEGTRVGRTLQNAAGIVQALDFGSEPIFLLDVPCEQTAFLVTGRYTEGGELPASFRRDGLRVVVSGLILEPPPNVRLPAGPLKITSIRAAEPRR